MGSHRRPRPSSGIGSHRRPGVLVVLCLLVAGTVAGLGVSESPEEGNGAGVLPGCPARCQCEMDGLLHRLDCSDLGLSDIPADLSVFTSYLDLSMNNLTRLSPHALSSLHFLEELRLAGNDLTEIPEGAFSGLYNLRVLMLQNNQLRLVPDHVFQSLPNLQSLRLDANHISSVPIGSFSGLHSLRHLWLDDNWLSEVPVRALSDLPALQAITLALNHITHIPDHAFSNLSSLVVLHLNNNRIVTMGTSCFHGLHSLETLDLNYNNLVEFPSGISSLSHLKELGFHSNSIQSIPEHAFTGNPSLNTIFFYDNPIQSVGRSAFENLPELRTLSLNGAADLTEFPDLSGTRNLESLTITGAQIVSLPPSMCEGLSNLRLLDLSYNQIRSLPSMSACESIQKIDLHHNQIEDVLENTFHGLMSLESIDLSWNKLSSVASEALSGLPALVKLDLSFNQLSSFSLTGLQSLSHLRLAGNSELMEFIPRESLQRVRVVELPYAFQCCVFVSCERRGGDGGEGEAISPRERQDVPVRREDPDWEQFLLDDEQKSQHTVQCSPAPGPFRPCLSLFGSWLIRSGVWLITALSLVSNGLVMLSVFLSPSSWATPPKLLIGWLALVNSLMGVWSGWLAVVDGWTFSSFWRYGVQWERSFLCRFSGFLCVFASQTGLFLLTLLALERSLARAPPPGEAPPPKTGAPPHKSIRSSRELDIPPSPPPFSVRLAVGLCFLLGLAVTMPPLLAGHSATALCLPLPSPSSSLAFCVSLLLLDSCCFLVMTLAYARLYCRAGDRKPPLGNGPPGNGPPGNGPPGNGPASGPPSPWERDGALTRHVAWLLFSDCLLFLPVAFASCSSLLRLPVAGPAALRGVLLLVVPLPACVNPLLYLLFSRPARHQLHVLGRRLLGALWGPRAPTGGGPAASEPWCDEDAEKQSCDSTQALVAMRRVGGEEEGEEEEGEEGEERGGGTRPPMACVAPCL